MPFSRKQQQVLGVLCLLYGVWLFWMAYADTQHTIQSYQLIHQDPPDLMFYIEPSVDINTSTNEELQFLPAIGPVLAQRIIAYREQHGPFTSLDSLQNVSRIGPKTLEKLQHYLDLPPTSKSSSH